MIHIVALVAALCLAASMAWSQTADPQTGDGGSPREVPDQIDEITVTGTQSDVTDIQAESQAISAFSMEELDRANIVSVDQLAFNVPALHVGQQGADSIITLRGVSTENASPTGEAGVQFHVDGVNYARPSAARVAFFDLEGLQVMRGPQGSRGGKNATAGWISVITRKPTDDFGIDGDFQWGAFNQRRLRSAINLPVNEYAQLRFATYFEDRNGYQRNLIFNDDDRNAFDADDFGFRGHLRLLPRENLEVLLSYNYYESKGVGPLEEVIGLNPERRCNPVPVFTGGTGYNPLTHFPSFAGCGANPNKTFPALDLFGNCPRGANCQPTPVFAATGFDLERQPRFLNFENPLTRGQPRNIAEAAATQPHRLYTDKPTGQENIFWGPSMTITADLPPLGFLEESTLKSITAFQVTHPDGFREADGTDLELFWGDVDRESEQFSQEFQWTGTSWGERLEWSGSLFFMREVTDGDTEFRVKLAGTQVLTIDQDTENESYGAALSTTWNLRENVSLRLGGRYIKDVKQSTLLRINPQGSEKAFNARMGLCNGAGRDVEGDFFRNADGSLFLDPNTGNPVTKGDGFPDAGVPTCQLKFRELVGDLTLNWWPRDENQLYFTVSNGFKSGGFALGESGSPNPTDTSLDTYQPEHIWAFMLGSKNTFFDERLTLNVEGYFYNYRDQQQVLVDGLSIRTDNADSQMQGIDIEFDAEPFPGLRFDGTVSVMDTEFTDYLAVDPLDVIVAAHCRLTAQADDPNFVSPFPGCTPTDYSGNELTRSPKLQYSIGAEYDIYLGRWGTLTPRVQFYWQDDTWYRPFNRTLQNSGLNAPCPIPGGDGGACVDGILQAAADGRDLQESYHFTDVKLVWTSPTETWTAEAFVQNLEDKVVYQNVLVSTPLLDSPQMAWYGAPRIYGFRAGFRF